jgi:hypothetical protein
MRELSASLVNAQQQTSVVPSVKVVAVNKIAGVVRYEWNRLYSGYEDDYFHTLAMAADGSLIRARVTLPADSRKLYRQRVANPGSGSDFSQWTYTGYYNVVVTAAASLDAEISIFWINSSREIRRIKSTDNGVTWSSAELIDYSPSVNIYGLAAAYKSNGDLSIFFADTAALYVKKNVSGQWLTKSAWDKTTGNLSGVSAIYDGDWKLLLTGKDSAGNYKLWSLVYGDGSGVTAGSWSALKELASAPSGGGFEYRQPFLDMTDCCRCFFVETFTGSDAYNRPFWSQAVNGVDYLEGLWREPSPFNLSSSYGLAMAHHGDYAWLSSPAGVWRALLSAQSLDLSGDIISLRHELTEKTGALTVELDNGGGKYSAPGRDDISVLDLGCQVEFSPGYLTSSGKEWSSGLIFSLDAFEHIHSDNMSALTLHAFDGWTALAGWQARHQFRWNKTADNSNVKAIIAFILGRIGIKLEVKSQSALATNFYPDFTVNPGDDGRTVINRLLSFIPDVLFIEGDTAYLVNPLSTDDSEYSYGVTHFIMEGRYYRELMGKNRVQAEGNSGGTMILADSFNWDEINARYDSLEYIHDKNLGTLAEVQARGQAVLREKEIRASGGTITVPVNCGQQIYDVIDITDDSAGLVSVKRRVLGLTLNYRPGRGEYSHRILLGGI